MISPLWYPYTQMKTMSPPLRVQEAQKCTLILEDNTRLIDGISSWWSTIHGYNHPELNQALIDQTQKMAHVMLGGLTHLPAENLAQKLVEITPDGLNHVFFSDSGSVAMEVSLKLALQFWSNQKRPQKNKFVSLKKGYHGDTCGVLSLENPESGFILSTPKPIFDITQVEEMETLFKTHHTSIAAFVIEPLMLGAGGFLFYPPTYLNHAASLCKKYDILIIFDEIATGFGRTGTLFATNQTGFSPDIMTLGKALTGGYIGHAATLTTSRIFDAFYGDSDTLAFMHGPTFMANPLACAVALKSIELFMRENYLDKIQKIHTQIKTALDPIKSPKIKETRTLGAVGVIEVHHQDDLNGLQNFARQRGVWLRPFGDIAYLAPPYLITPLELRQILDTFIEFF